MKSWTIIETKKEYEAVLERIEELSQYPPEKKSDEGRELMLLGYLADRYEEERFHLTYPDPVEAIKERMAVLELSLNDMLDVFGDRGTASKVLNRNRSLSLNMIRKLSEKLSLPEALLIKPTARSTERTAALVHEPKQAYKKRGRKQK